MIPIKQQGDVKLCNWITRFYLGLPCRPEDRKELEDNLPELFQVKGKTKTNPTYIRDIFRGELDAENIRKWAESYEVTNNNKESSKVADICPVCSKIMASDSTDENIKLNIEMAGGTNRKSSVPAFMQLVNRNKKSKVKDPIKDVYFTDRYLLADEGESGVGGGYDNIIKYLDNLSIESDCNFTIHIPSWPSRSKTQKDRGDSLSEAKNILQRTIKSKFNNVQFKQLSQKAVFHDRLYLTRGSDGNINGVFGPSLNSLNSTDIALMGEIEDKELLKKLDAILSKNYNP